MSDLKRSIFLSRQPLVANKKYAKTPDDTPDDKNFKTEFLYVCSEAYPSYSVNYMMTSFGMPGLGTENAIVIDSMSGAIGRLNVSGIRVGDAEYGSNAFFQKEIRKMRSILQLRNNAYILRIYNASMLDSEGKLKSIGDTYVDFYVFLKGINCSVSAGSPKVMSVGITLVQRNPLMGFNVYSGGT